MPTDEWAKATRRDFGNRAAASGSFWRRNEGLGKRKRRGKRRRKGQKPGKVRGCSCGSTDISRKMETFEDGTVHKRVSCNKCGKFIKWERWTG